MPLGAATCRPLPGQQRNPALLLTPLPPSQAEGRRFEPGLALQVFVALPGSSVGEAFFWNVADASFDASFRESEPRCERD